MSEELKPCPFDGAKGDELSLTYEGFDAHLNWFVRCYHCCVETQRYDSEEEAIAAWNRRTSPIPEGGEEMAGEMIDALMNANIEYVLRGRPDDQERLHAARTALLSALLSSPRVDDVRRMREALVQISSMEIDINFMADQLVWAKGLAREALSLLVE
tara:strand:+ start:26612 stop:27082 length:471 start_codon:yes stop_codon:yes gene_type:complete